MYNKLISKRAKKLISVAVASALVITAIPAFEAEAATASKNKLSATTKTLAVGQKYTLTIKNKTKGAKVTYKLYKNTKAATVSAKGKITAKKKGTAYIMATVKKGKKTYRKGLCKVKVITGAKTVKINQKAFTLYVKGTKKLTVTMTKKGHGDKATWSSNKKTVATVSSTGKVTAKKAGTATITAKTISGKKATVKVTVKNKPTTVTPNPVTPNPVTPDPVTPNPVTPDPIIPTSSPIVPTSSPVVPTSSPVVPTSSPVVPTSSPVVPTSSPVVPTSSPVVPTSSPVVPTGTPIAATGTVTVSVVDIVSHVAVTGATVSVKVATAGGATVATASSIVSGNAFVLANGNYTIVVEKAGYDVATKAAVVSGDAVALTIMLAEETVTPVTPPVTPGPVVATNAAVTVNVKNVSGTAVGAARITVKLASDGAVVATASSVVVGKNIFTVPNGEYVIEAVKTIDGVPFIATASAIVAGVAKTVNLTLVEEIVK